MNQLSKRIQIHNRRRVCKLQENCRAHRRNAHQGEFGKDFTAFPSIPRTNPHVFSKEGVHKHRRRNGNPLGQDRKLTQECNQQKARTERIADPGFCINFFRAVIMSTSARTAVLMTLVVVVVTVVMMMLLLVVMMVMIMMVFMTPARFRTL